MFVGCISIDLFLTCNSCCFTANISLVLPILHAISESDSSNSEESGFDDSMSASSLIAGMILGQLIFGFLGDVLGRNTSLCLVIVLQIIASIGSSMIYFNIDGNVQVFFDKLISWRFVLGIGAGGVYPLAALLSAEDDDDDGEDDSNTHEERILTTEEPEINNADFREEQKRKKKWTKIAITFSTQGLGFISVPLFTWFLLLVFPSSSNNSLNYIWRIILGCGCLPGFVILVLFLSIKRNNNDDNSSSKSSCLSRTIDFISKINIPEIAHRRSKYSQTATTVSQQELEEPLLLPSSLVQETETNNDITTTMTQLSRDEQEHSQQQGNLELIPTTNTASMTQHNIIATEEEENEEVSGDRRSRNNVEEKSSLSFWQSIRLEPNPFRKLIGTAITWFLFDLLFYGNTLFQPVSISLSNLSIS